MIKVCKEYPPNASYKTIGWVPPCKVCGEGVRCWNAYLAWERSVGIKRAESDLP